MCAPAIPALASIAALLLSTHDAANSARALPSIVAGGEHERLVVAQRGRGRKGGKGGKGKTVKTETPPPVTPPPPVGSTAPANLPPPPALAAKYRAIAFLPFEANGVSDEALRALEQSMANEIDEKPKLRSVNPRDVMAEVSPVGLSMEQCVDEDLACFARIGRYARAHQAVLTRLGVFGGTLKLSLRLIDTQSGAELSRVAESLSDKPEDRATELHRMIVQLLSPDQYVGTLVLDGKEPGAEVFLNDKLIGTTPIKQPLKNLRAGPYILRVSKAGFSDLYQFVDVIYKKTSTITFDLATNTITGTINVTSETGFGSVFVVTNLPDVEIRLDGEPKGKTPLEVAIAQVAAGTRRLSLRREGSDPLVEEIEVKKGERTDVGVMLSESGGMQVVARLVKAQTAPLPAAPSDVDPATPVAALDPNQPGASAQLRGPSWLFPAGLVTAGAGALALMVSGVFATQVAKMDGEADAIEDRCPTVSSPTCRAADPGRMDELNEDGPKAERRQWITLGIGGGLVAVGGLLVLSDMMNWFAPEPSTSVGAPGEPGTSSMSVAPLDGGALLFYSSSF